MSRLIALSVLCLYRYVTVMPIQNSCRHDLLVSLEYVQSIRDGRPIAYTLQVRLPDDSMSRKAIDE